MSGLGTILAVPLVQRGPGFVPTLTGLAFDFLPENHFAESSDRAQLQARA